MQLGAEFVGTFILIFSAAAGPIVNQKHNGVETLIGNALCAGLAVMIVVLSTGHISGAHLNPSVTIAFAALRHFPWLQVPAYIAVQVSASICAAFVLKGAFHPFMSGGVTVPSVSNGQAFVLEFIITFILLFVITAVATDTRAVPCNRYKVADDAEEGRRRRREDNMVEICRREGGGCIQAATVQPASKFADTP
ncbi:hypothetical protein RHGRI_035611 [Rhododendron griersonianum]|uniref:Aquaporin NIP5-1 n=1 Tax=Rhododendron griersonianum TaxID=479676 RepID=A0AAV6HNV0_9ERIC|nr:hypothetical protein RHGRI_035611 [Rhododendron griersonianum]